MGGSFSRPVVSCTVKERNSTESVDEQVPAYLRSVYRLMYEQRVGRFVCHYDFLSRPLESLTAVEGNRMNQEESAKAILPFIATYGVNVEESEFPVSHYRTFNEFFARRLKAGLRPIAEGRKTFVSPADCRFLAFPKFDAANAIWLKGEPLSLRTLLTDEFFPLFPSDHGVSVSICRLAPNDYHRWHCPIDCVAGPRVVVPGTLFSVSPWAVRSIDVLGRNRRVISILESPDFGTVALIAVGAAMVASMKFEPDTEAGCSLSRGQPHGWFENGGSTLVIVSRADRIVYDEDLVENSMRAQETIIKMGEKIAVARENEENPVAPEPLVKSPDSRKRGRKAPKSSENAKKSRSAEEEK